ncbi:MAG: hypothetical protein FH749_12895 [Firmicutes bacterium]|nr:hypothetical protein [Bacillota bacterium]
MKALAIVLLVIMVAAVIILFNGGLSQLPWLQRHIPSPGQNYMSRQSEVPPPMDKELEEEFVAAYFTVNMDRMMERMRSTTGKMTTAAPPISPGQYLAFGDSELLGGSIYSASIGVYSVPAISVVDAHLGGGLDRPIMGIQSSADIPEFMMSLQGGRFGEFNNGLRSVAAGRMPDALNECIVSEELARTAGLSVGDTLSLSSFVQDKDRNRKDIGFELTIVGIYRDSTNEYANGARQNAYTNRRNEILTTFETVGSSIPTGYSGAQLAATYYLKSPDLLDAFAKEVYAKGLDPVYDVVSP